MTKKTKRTKRRIARFVYQYGGQFRIIIPIDGEAKYFGQRSNADDAIKVRDDVLRLLKESGIEPGRKTKDPVERAAELIADIENKTNL